MHTFPHALDFDWRFEEASVLQISNLVPRSARVLSLGAPTVASKIEERGGSVLLIDRRPDLSSANHIAEDIDLLSNPITGFNTAIVDPPWYQESLQHWAIYAGHCLGVGGRILFTAWPSSARPAASEELSTAIGEISQWAKVCELAIRVAYEVPRFEQAAIEASSGGPLSTSPRVGVLYEAIVERTPPRLLPLNRSHIWLRFVVDEYQLALRSNAQGGGLPSIARHPNAIDWKWPFVSRRAPGLADIDLWSSEGEVARVRFPAALADVLRSALAAGEEREFYRALQGLPDLQTWKIPRPPYRRLIEWAHRQ